MNDLELPTLPSPQDTGITGVHHHTRKLHIFCLLVGLFCFMYIGVLLVCVLCVLCAVSTEARRRDQILGSGVTDDCRCWESNLGPLREQSVLSTLVPLFCFLSQGLLLQFSQA